MPRRRSKRRRPPRRGPRCCSRVHRQRPLPQEKLYNGDDIAKLVSVVSVVSVVSDDPEQLEIETASSEERYLVLADRYYPGWIARVDGKEVEILRAYGVLRALRLGPGRHRVSFEFRPRSVRRGLAVTGASALLLMMLGLARRRL